MFLYKENNRSTVLLNYCGFSNIHWTQFVVNFLLHVCQSTESNVYLLTFFFSRLWCSLVYTIMRSLWIACCRKTTKKENSSLNWLWPNRYSATLRCTSFYHLILELVSLIHSPLFHSIWLVANQLEVYLKKKTIIQMLLVIYMCVWSSKWLISTHFKQYQ